MGARLYDWFTNISSTAKAVVALVALSTLVASATLAVSQQVALPERVFLAEHAIDSLRIQVKANAEGIEAVRKDTRAILCILTLPPGTSPVESRVRCP